MTQQPFIRIRINPGHQTGRTGGVMPAATQAWASNAGMQKGRWNLDLNHDGLIVDTKKCSVPNKTVQKSFMRAREIMCSVVRMLNPDQNLVAAARLMKQHDIGCILVGSEGHLVGIVTDRDIAVRGVLRDCKPGSIRLAEVMTRDPVFCKVDDTLLQIARIMEENQVRRLPVLDAGRRVVGLVSMSDVCAHAPHQISGELIRAVSRPRTSGLAPVA
jgi:CBS domain-containing protein